jgi:hypothetical protein
MGVLAGKLYFGGNVENVFYNAYRHGNAWKHSNQAILSTFILEGKSAVCNSAKGEKKLIRSYCAKGEKKTHSIVLC